MGVPMIGAGIVRGALIGASNISRGLVMWLWPHDGPCIGGA